MAEIDHKKEPSSALAYVRVDFKFKTKSGFAQEVGYSTHQRAASPSMVLMDAIYELSRVAALAGYGPEATLCVNAAREAVARDMDAPKPTPWARG